MRITDAQNAILEGLTCERLSSDPDSMRLVDDFFNRRNPSLAHTLQNEAMEEDQEGKTAYYIIKDANGNILFYFSLKSGSLYDSHLDANVIKLFKTLNAYIQDSLSDPDLSDRQRLALGDVA